MLPKGKRRQSVKAEYRRVRTEVEEQKAREAALRAEQFLPEEEAAGDEEFYDVAEMMAEDLPDPRNPYLRLANTAGTRNDPQTEEAPRYEGLKRPEREAPEIALLDDLDAEDGVRGFVVEAAAKGMRLDAFLAKALPDVSRGRVQLLIEKAQVRVDGGGAKASQKLKGGERVEIEGQPQPEPLRAEPEEIPLEIVYEDADMAVINKPAGMTVHAGAGSAEQNRGTLVNALLWHFGNSLSSGGDALRPGIVHRLDKETSGLIVVAKNDFTHRRLAEMFAGRELRKVYIALVQGWMRQDEGTVDLPIARDANRRIRMTTKRADGRNAVSHWRVLERFESAYGKFTLVEVRIETGRTHQIRVHLQAIGHAVVGDVTYGAARVLRGDGVEEIEPGRNFLHAAELDLRHPRTGEELELRSELPKELKELLERLRG
jgi:23S rRNA pseudouridine1911/1915/1917 synthase